MGAKKNSKKKVAFVHLLNNYSGSPNVLSNIVEQVTGRGIYTILITSFNNEGFLSKIKCEKHINVEYRFYENQFLRLLCFLRFQLLASFHVSLLSKDTVVYINTIQPFLPAIVAKIKGLKVIYHVHEAYPDLSVLNKFLFSVLNNTATKIICVSKYVSLNLYIKDAARVHVVYNSLNSEFTNMINLENKTIYMNRKTVLMISSARPYKGIFQFCELAKNLHDYNFILVCDTTSENIQILFAEFLNLNNLNIYPTQVNLHSFYQKADLLLNLSNPNLIIETFGLTVLEAMSYGIPAIIPNMGGIVELVENGYNGYHVDVNDLELLKSKIVDLLEDNELYKNMSRNAKAKSKEFDNTIHIKSIVDILQ